MVKFWTLVVIMAALAICSEGKFFKDCGSSANIKKVNIGGCTSKGCIFHKGKTYNINMVFTPTSNAASLPTKVTTKVLGITKTLLSGNACSQLQNKCPIEAGREENYNGKATIPEEAPSVGGEMKILVQDERGKNVVCGNMKFKVEK